MTDRIATTLAFVILVVFLGILWWWVPRVDLAVVLGSTIVLVFIDLFVKRRKS